MFTCSRAASNQHRQSHPIPSLPSLGWKYNKLSLLSKPSSDTRLSHAADVIIFQPLPGWARPGGTDKLNARASTLLNFVSGHMAVLLHS